MSQPEVTEAELTSYLENTRGAADNIPVLVSDDPYCYADGGTIARAILQEFVVIRRA